MTKVREPAPDEPVDLGSAQAIAGVARASREPGFLERGRASVRDVVREAANYRELLRTPYGLRPIAIFVALGIIGTFDGRVFGAARPEIIRDLDLDLVGLFGVLSIIGFFLIFAVLLLAYVGDRVRRVPFVGLSAILTGVASLVTAGAHTMSTLGVSRAADGISGALDVPTSSLQADYYPPESRGKVFALYGVLGRATGLAAPLTVAWLATATSLRWRFPYLITGPLLIAAGVGALLMLREPVRGYMERRSLGESEEVARIAEEPPSFGEAWRTVWSIRTLRRLFISDIPAVVGDGLYDFFFVLLLFQTYHLDITDRALLSTVVAVVTLPFGFLGGGVVDVLTRRRPERVLVFTGLLSVVGSLAVALIATAPPLWLLALIFVVFGCATALLGPARSVLFLQILPAHVRTLGGSVRVLAALPGTVIRFWVVAYAFTRWGIQGALAAAVPFYLVSALIELSAAGLFARDMRAAIASQTASAEWRRSVEAGTAKMLVCRDVDVEYDGVQVLFGVDFDVEEGDVIALLGTNGAGKSTLLKAIAGTQEAASGAIVFNGRDITHMPPQEIAARGVVFMPGGRGVFPTLTVRENLRLGNWLNDTDAQARLEEVYAIFPLLRQRLDERAQVLSGGEQQMLSLAQAFLSRPKLLMIDELSLGLSPAVVGQLLDIVRRIHEQGATIILVEQSVNVALTVCERAVFMEKGEVRFVGRTADLLRRPDILRAIYVKGTGALVEGAPAGARRTVRERRQQELVGARAVLEVREVSKSFGGVRALDAVSIDLRDGEVLGLIGPNGAGKTTLFDVIGGYQRPDSGRIVYDGVDVTTMPPDERARLRLVRRFQDARLFPALSVYENILVALDRKLDVRSIPLTALQLPQVRSSERRIRQQAERLVELLELGANRDKFVRELSTGLRRITDLACVLASEPKVLLLDEPSSGIAQAEAESLGPMLRRVRHDVGCSILIIEHDMTLIAAVSDELVAMDQGRVVVRGTPDAVLNDERVIEAYLGTSEDVIARSGTASARMTR